jgi:hypothetical protein
MSGEGSDRGRNRYLDTSNRTHARVGLSPCLVSVNDASSQQEQQQQEQQQVLLARHSWVAGDCREKT